MSNKRNYQKGHASILFVIIVPALFGVFMLGSDGARALQQKARVMDAAEVAALAVSAHADDNQEGSTVNTAIVTDVMKAYFPSLKDGDLQNINIVRKNCEQIADCNTEGHRFFQYQVSATVKYDSWFPGNDAIAGFGDEISVAGAGTSRKYQSDAIDVMLVADFSGSMDDGWRGGSKRKYKDLVDIIEDVADELQKFNDLKIPDKINTIGIVPYSADVYRDLKGNGCANSNTYKAGEISHLETVRKCVRWRWGRCVEYRYYVDYEKTIESMYRPYEQCGYDRRLGSHDYYSLALTRDFNKFKKDINKFEPTGGTASYEGIIDGFKLLRHGKNDNRLLIILSDGQDNRDYKKHSSELINNHKMCEKIRDELERDDKEATMYLIGFDYTSGSTNIPLDNCVGKDNILYAQNKDQILNKILSLIAEEIGHLK
ncbi:TadE/TadG family type IV pilus assembly protein [Vibrio fluminensis]|uniref:TadE/TadG family type IV pilus assembly protein n=1 Tax=Vibrio fluminensis TaxID=2783614 RepID=UPI001888068C|nr:TadE/TadG family type IV pilus assembly protein [Vibrio fluminensis]